MSTTILPPNINSRPPPSGAPNLGNPTERPAPGDYIVSGGTPGSGNGSSTAAFVAKLVNSGKYAHAQSMLSRLGYNIAQDGKWGAQSRSAYHAYLSGMSPAKWAAAMKKAAAPVRRASGGSGGGSGGSGGGGGGGISPVVSAASAAPSSVPAPPSIASILGSSYNQLNAAKVAADMTAAQFNPIEAQLNQNLKLQNGMIPGINAATTQAYAPAVSAANALAGQDQQGAAQANAATQSMAQALMGLLGPNSAAAGNLGALAANHIAGANTLSANQQNLDRSNAAAFQGHVGDVANYTRQGRLNAVKALQDQLTQEKGQRGLAYTKNLAGAVQQRSDLLSKAYGDQSLIQNMNLAAALAGPTVTGANLKNAQAAQNLTNSGVQASDQHNLSIAQTNSINTSIAQAMQKMGAAGESNFGSLKGADLANFEHTIVGSPGILDNGANSPRAGRLNVSPDQLFQTAVQQYSSLFGNDPKMKNFIGNTINKYMIGSRFAGHYKWDNTKNKFVKTGR